MQQTDQESKHSYTVYLIEVNNNGLCQTVSRRYSEFDELYKMLKKWIPSSEVTEFPGEQLQGVGEGGMYERKFSCFTGHRPLLGRWPNRVRSHNYYNQSFTSCPKGSIGIVDHYYPGLSTN